MRGRETSSERERLAVRKRGRGISRLEQEALVRDPVELRKGKKRFDERAAPRTSFPSSSAGLSLKRPETEDL
jgi:hypothetical protein